jgi:hypothetical protein
MRYVLNPIPVGFMSVLLMAVAGCASIRSTKLPMAGKPQAATAGGMVYYLPMQRLELTLTVSEQKPDADGAGKKQEQAADAGTKQQKNQADKKPTPPAAPPKLARNITISESRVFGDPDARYVAQYRRNHIGSNALKVTTNVDGLLSGEGSGSTTSGVAEFLRAAADLQGTSFSFTATDRETGLETKPNLCAKAGVYKWTFDAKLSSQIEQALRQCQIEVSVCDPGNSTETCALSDQSPPDQSWKYANRENYGRGYFYRQKRTFEIRTRDELRNIQQVFYVSLAGRHSPTEFMPIPRTVFADTDWKVGFTDGIPTVYDIKAGGDVLGLVKLPAEVVKAYSEAVLAGVKRKGQLAEEEVKSLQQLNALAAQQVKYEACRAAAQTGEKDKIEAACK